MLKTLVTTIALSSLLTCSAMAVAGRLVSVDNDWYIADCEQNVIVQIKQSLLEELQEHGTLDTHIHQGDLLALDQNKQGQIIALKQLTHEAKKCEA